MRHRVSIEKQRVVWPFQKRLAFLEKRAGFHGHEFFLKDNGNGGYTAVCSCGAYIAKPRKRR